MKLCLYGMTLWESPLWNGRGQDTIASKRNILNNKTLALMFTGIGSLVWGLKFSGDRISETDKQRLWYFFVMDAAIGVSWNFLAYNVGYRWLSRDGMTGKPSESKLDHYFGMKYIFQLLITYEVFSSVFMTKSGLTWDGAVEISAMYSLFVVTVFAFMKK